MYPYKHSILLDRYILSCEIVTIMLLNGSPFKLNVLYDGGSQITAALLSCKTIFRIEGTSTMPITLSTICGVDTNKD